MKIFWVLHYPAKLPDSRRHCGNARAGLPLPQGIIRSVIHAEVEHIMNQRRYKPTLDRTQRLFLPERVEDYVGENHRVRALDAYVDTLDLGSVGFKHTERGTVAGQPHIIFGRCLNSIFTDISTGYVAVESLKRRPEGTLKQCGSSPVGRDVFGEQGGRARGKDISRRGKEDLPLSRPVNGSPELNKSVK